MMNVRKISIAPLVIIILVVIIATLLSIAGMLAYKIYSDLRWRELRSLNMTLTEQSAIGLSLPLWNFDRKQIGKVAESIMSEQSVYAIVIWQTNPREIIQTLSRDTEWKIIYPEREIFPDGLLVQERTIHSQNEDIGSVQIYMTSKFLNESLENFRIAIIASIVIFTFIVFIILYLLLWNIVLKPVQILDKFAIEVSKGNFDKSRLPEMHFIGELNTLNVSITSMITLLESRYIELQKETKNSMESEKRFRTLIKTIPDLIWLKDPNGVYISCNPMFERLFGATEQDIIGKTDFDFVDPELANFFQAKDREAIALGEPSINEEWLTFADDGHRAMVETVKVPMYDVENKLLGVLGVARDITERKSIENELHKSQANLTALIESTIDLMWSVDQDYRLLTFNSMLEEHFKKNYATKTFIGALPTDLLPPERAALWPPLYQRALEEGSYKLEYDLADGRTLELSFHPIVQDSKPIGISVFGKDITERKRSEIALRESEERFRSLYESVPIGLVRTSSTGEILDCNLAADNLAGYKNKGDLIGRNAIEFWAEPEARKYMFEKVIPNETFEYDFKLKRCDNNIIWIRNRAKCCYDDLGNVLYFDVSLVDITERKLAEDSLKQSEEKFAKAFRSSPDLIVITNTIDGKIIEVNDRVQEITGYTREEIIGKTTFELEMWADLSVREQILAGILKNGYIHNLEVKFRFKFNRIIDTLLSGELLELKDGRYILAVIRDITDSKHAKEDLYKLNQELEQRIIERTFVLENKTLELEEANLKLKEVDKLKSMFIASMSHELRTPLNSIIGFSSILLNEWVGTLNAEQKENLSFVLQSGKHLLSLISDVIDVSKIEAGMIDTHFEDFDINDLINEALKSFVKEIENRDLSLVVESINQKMYTDKRRLLQVIINLTSNAMKYTEKGELKIIVRNIDDHYIEIDFCDTGIGIKEEDLDYLFLAFSRIDSPLRMKISGTGLGLYLTKKLVNDILKGEIWVKSVYGQGSTFTIRVLINIKEAL